MNDILNSVYTQQNQQLTHVVSEAKIVTDHEVVSGRMYEIHNYADYRDQIPGYPSHVIVGLNNMYMRLPVEYLQILIATIVTLIIIVIIMLIMYTIWRHRDVVYMTKFPQYPISDVKVVKPNINNNTGASTTGIYDDGYNGNDILSPNACDINHGEWLGYEGTCSCIAPNWGASCERVSYDSNYFASGIINTKSPNVRIEYSNTSPPFKTSLLSLGEFVINDNDELACTTACNQNEECKGVLWDNKTQICRQVNKVVLKNLDNIEWSNTEDSNLYIKRSALHDHPIYITDRVLVYCNILHPRSQFIDHIYSNDRLRGNGLQWFKSGVIKQINFYPRHVINRSGLIGLYSTVPFTYDEYSMLIKMGNNEEQRIDYGDGQITIPLEWSTITLWVMYSF